MAKRYWVQLNGFESGVEEIEEPDGKWVRYDDYAAIENLLREFVAFQIGDYDRKDSMAKKYCEIRRRARQLLNDSREGERNG